MQSLSNGNVKNIEIKHRFGIIAPKDEDDEELDDERRNTDGMGEFSSPGGLGDLGVLR